jgi:hypothetical protein
MNHIQNTPQTSTMQSQSTHSAPPVLQPARVVGAGLAPATKGADVCVEQAHFDDPRDRLYCEAIAEADALRQELRQQQAAARARQDHNWTLAFSLSLISVFSLLFVIDCARSAVKIYFPTPHGIGHGMGVVTPIGRLNV